MISVILLKIFLTAILTIIRVSEPHIATKIIGAIKDQNEKMVLTDVQRKYGVYYGMF